MQLRKVNFKGTFNNSSLWRDVVGYEGLYMISYNGLVYSLISNKLLRPGFTKATGYFSVSLFRSKGQHHTHFIHRMIAEAFLPNPENKRTVNHILGEKTMNHVACLEWATTKENNLHAIKTGLRKVKCTPEMIDSILALHIKADPINGAAGLAKRFGVNKSTIHDILNQHKYFNHGI